MPTKPKHKTWTPKPCAQCGAIFTPRGTADRCCSPKCALTINSRRRRSGCIEWIGPRRPDGYGVLKVREQIHEERVHRLAYTLAKGPIPKGLLVMHACDNRCCVNPKHLSLGTHLDNTRDMLRKGRYGKHGRTRGEAHYMAKLTRQDVFAIEKEWALKQPRLSALAKKYGVSVYTIADVIRGKAWAWLKSAK